MTTNTPGLIRLSFAVEKETKNAVRYTEIGADQAPVPADLAKVGTLYVKKSAFKGGTWPTILTVTIE